MFYVRFPRFLDTDDKYFDYRTVKDFRNNLHKLLATVLCDQNLH